MICVECLVLICSSELQTHYHHVLCDHLLSADASVIIGLLALYTQYTWDMESILFFNFTHHLPHTPGTCKMSFSFTLPIMCPIHWGHGKFPSLSIYLHIPYTSRTCKVSFTFTLCTMCPIHLGHVKYLLLSLYSPFVPHSWDM